MSTAVVSVPVSVPVPVGRLASVGAVIFCANAALLVLQLVAGRLLAPFVGSSLETWTSIIGVFLTGIALGNGWGGKLADRYPTPRTLGLVLLVGAATALWMLVLPSLLNATGLYKTLPLGPRIPLLATLLCLPAGFVLSLLTPLAIKLGLPDVGHTGRVAGLIFALSTLGCLIGNYLTGFYLIPNFTINTLVGVCAVLLVVLAGVAFLMRAADKPLVLESAAHPAAATTNPYAFPDIKQAYLIVFLASFCGMALELTASRIMAQHLGVSLFTWTGVIGVMLAGTAGGNFLGGVLADMASRPHSRLHPRIVLASTLIAAGGGTVLIFVMLAIVTRTEVFSGWEPILQVVGWTFSLFFLPMFLLGMVSPQVIRLSVPDVAHVGRVAGRVYAWSTVGAIVGTFATGYVLISQYGFRYTLLGIALVSTLTSLLIVNIWSEERSSTEVNRPNAAYNAPRGGTLLYFFSIVMGGITGGFILTNRIHSDEYVVQVESNYYSIRISRTGDPRLPEPALNLYLDRLLHSIVDPYDPTFIHYTHEHIQMEFLRLLRAETPHPKTLVIGGGGYTFPRYAKAVMPECVMDVVEIDPKVTQVAYEYLGLRKEFGIHHFHMDGRQYIAEVAAPGSYDLIVQDAVNDFSVPAHLMTKEYNDAVKAALKPQGIYLLTIIDSLADGQLWKAALATLAQTFPEKNVVLLTADGVEPAGTPDGAAWERDRRVMVIYASDRPFSWEALDAAMENRSNYRQVALQMAPPEWPGSGLAVTTRLALAAYYEIPRSPRLYTHEIPRSRVQHLLDREPGVILTDQFCPIDNLMAEVFRKRMRE
ncbi:MAG: fused MFS/spermidine synthase [Gemmataceae bacterium]|nr:fused MFS/spermidine synthase [Gemmata sp.]MDW8198008.1 fused MFS/spermidine synthase [Gemmataceae bacterium]